MLAYVGARLIQAVPVLLLASLVIFGFIRLIPGDPALALAGQNATPSRSRRCAIALAWIVPSYEQYLTWISHAARGDLGVSYISDRPVADLIRQRIPATIQLALGSVLVMLLIGGPSAC